MTLHVGYHLQEDSYTGPAIGAATFLDVGGVTASSFAAERMCRVYFTGRPQPAWLAGKLAEPPAAGLRCVAANEPNLEMEGFGGGPADYAAWFEAVADLVPAATRLYYAGMSPGVPGWEEWYTDPAARAAIERAAGLCVHTYGDAPQMQETVAWVRAQFPDKLIWVGEYNWGAGRQIPDLDAWVGSNVPPFLDWLSTDPLIEAATWFSWFWDQSASLPTSVNAAGTAIETVIRDWTPPDQPNPGPEETVLEGTDCSNWQAEVDWSAVAASGRRFAIVKSSEDPAYRDPYFGANWRGIKAANLTRGCYHYARPSQVSPAESVAFFAQQIAAVGGLEPGDLVALDIEDTDVAPDADLAGWVVDWLVAAETELGLRPLVYSGEWYLEPHVIDDPDLAEYPLWLAAYQDTPPEAPAPWDALAFWQYSAHGTVPGISGDADLNQFLGDEAALRALGYGGTESDQVQPLRDQTWQLCDQLQVLGGQWTDAGWTSTGSGIASAAEAIKTIIRGTSGQQ